MRTLVACFLLAALAGCDDTPPVCHFPSGRPCPTGAACLNVQGQECSYVACLDGTLQGAAVACMPGPIQPSGTGPHDCDPSGVPAPDGLLTPPNGGCPIGGLYTIVNHFWGTCVPVAECRPLPCDPAYAGDGCPSNHGCDALTRLCVPT
jgi:hypothetical protein